MPQSMPEAWWDAVLNGDLFLVNVVRSGFGSLQGFRSQCYLQADRRQCVIATKKISPTELLFQAWGNPDKDMELSTPKLLENKRHARQVPEPPEPARRRLVSCTCGYGPRRHMPGCAMAPPIFAPGPGPQSAVEELEAGGEDELLGPCTCGQAPACLPSCARAGGVQDQQDPDQIMEPAAPSAP